MAVRSDDEEQRTPLVRRFLRRIARSTYRSRLTRVHERHGMARIQRELYEAVDPLRVLKMFGASVGAGTVVYPRLRIGAFPAISDFSGLRLGSRCHVGRDCYLDLTAGVTFADEAGIAMLTMVLTRDEDRPGGGAPVRFLRGAMTGACASILPGVTIGECSLVAAGSAVMADVPDRVVVAGSPARIVRHLPRHGPSS